VRGLLADYGMEWSIGAPFQDTIAALRLVMSGTLARYPDLRLVVPHLGGTLPFLLSRIELHWSRASSPEGTAPPSSGIRRLYLDTAQSTPAMLSLAADAIGADHLVFGTDFPYVNRTDFRAPANDLRILGDDAARAVFRSCGLGLST
jgi:predicted TIM-barrel fold metal-dependent hydrolase